MTDEKSVRIAVNLKNAGSLTKKVKNYPLVLQKKPRTLRELIGETVKTCLKGFAERSENADNPGPLTEEQYAGMREIGKFTFGALNEGKVPDEETAIRTALGALEDGLVRVFRGNEELNDPDTETEVDEGDVFTFVRLTMLSGRMW